MANQKIALGINLRKNKIETSSGYGKYYPEVDVQKTLSLRGFAKHMTDHGSIYGRDIVKAIHIRFLPDVTKTEPSAQSYFCLRT